MNYKRVYESLVERATLRGLNKGLFEGYFEKHHVLPKCMGGNDGAENLVLLTGREHFIAHKLLCKVYPEQKSLFFALYQMSIDPNDRGYKVSSREYQNLKTAFSENQKGENNPSKREEVRIKMSRSKKGRPSSFKGKSHSEKVKKILSEKAKISNAGEGNPMYGKTHSEEAKKKISEKNKGKPSPMRGKTHSEGARKKMSEKSKGIPRPDVSERAKLRNIRPWETPHARSDLSILKFWADADKVYDVWKDNKDITYSFLRKLLGSDHGYTSWRNLVKRFLSGWIPVQDSKWVEFTFEISMYKDIS